MDDTTVAYILTLFNAFLALKYVPQKWRDVNVIFIPKPGKTDYTDNRAFKSIYVMSFLLKTLERLVLWHIQETNLRRRPMHNSQFGFRKRENPPTEH
jgi:hypothetical protein